MYPLTNRSVQSPFMVAMCLHSILVIAFGALIVIIMSGRSILGTVWIWKDFPLDLHLYLDDSQAERT